MIELADFLTAELAGLLLGVVLFAVALKLLFGIWPWEAGRWRS
jgi:hypothetical protein